MAPFHFLYKGNNFSNPGVGKYGEDGSVWRTIWPRLVRGFGKGTESIVSDGFTPPIPAKMRHNHGDPGTHDKLFVAGLCSCSKSQRLLN